MMPRSLLSVLCCAVLALSSVAVWAEPSSKQAFVTRKGDALYEGEKVFRFVSFNLPGLHINENPVWHRITPWEQEDGIRSIAQMGGRVVRVYTLSIQGGRRNVAGPSHVLGPRSYNEDLLRDFDKMLALCAKHGVRLIIPFIDEWEWWGGIDEFSKFHGKTKKEFYTDPAIQEDFRALVRMLLTRVNTVTGIAYRDDPSIMAWESGNELRNDPEAWVISLAAYVKGLAPQQLFQDGHCGPREAVLADQNIDLTTSHYYGEGDYVAMARRDRALTRGKKPFYVGEYDPRRAGSLVDEVIANGSAGVLAWSLRGHAKEGGFFYHSDPLFYHWPLSPLTRQIRRAAYAIQGCSESAMEIPGAPELLPSDSPRELTWKGSAGAESYRLERSLAPEGPWTLVQDNLTDKRYGGPLADDEQAPANHPLYYRLRAQNRSGQSEWSAVMRCGR